MKILRLDSFDFKGSPAFGFEYDGIAQDFKRGSFAQLLPSPVWVNIMWGDEGEGKFIDSSTFEKTTSVRDWTNINWKNYVLVFKDQEYTIQSNTSSQLVVYGSFSGSIGVVDDFLIKHTANAFEIEIKQLKPDSSDVEATFLSYSTNKVKDRIRNLTPGVKYKIRVIPISSFGVKGEGTNYKDFQPKLSLTDNLKPKTNDWKVEVDELNIKVKNTMSSDRIEELEDAGYLGAEFVYTMNGSISQGTSTDTPSFDSTENTIYAPVTKKALTIHTPSDRKLRIGIRYLFKDGQVTDTKEIKEEVGGVCEIIDPRAPAVDYGHRCNKIIMDRIEDTTQYKKVSTADYAKFAEIESARGTFSNLGSRLQRYDDIKDKVDLAISETGKINPDAIDTTTLAAIVLRNDNLPDSEIDGVKIKSLKFDKVSEITGTLSLNNLPTTSMITTNIDGSYGGLKKLTNITVNSVQTSIPHGLSTTPTYIIPVVKTVNRTVAMTQEPDSTNIYFTASANETIVDFYVR
jgi:hypothetical protein